MTKANTQVICATKIFCKTCLVNPAWRAKYNMPDVCPFGITLENLPNKDDIKKTQKSAAGSIKGTCGRCKKN